MLRRGSRRWRSAWAGRAWFRWSRAGGVDGHFAAVVRLPGGVLGTFDCGYAASVASLVATFACAFLSGTSTVAATISAAPTRAAPTMKAGW
jgi:hypothetical protein